MKRAFLLKPANALAAIIVLILVLVPFDALITVWPASVFGHYTALRLWDETLLLIAALLAVALCFKYKIWRRLGELHIFWLVIAYAVLQISLGLISYDKHDVTAKALGYGWIVDLRYPLFFLVCLVAASQADWLKQHWRQLLLVPAAIVVLFGLLQFFALPYDFLRHLGYSAQTIFPYETINHNLKYIRIMSTLRGANPLGAYLIIVASALTVLFIKAKTRNWRLVYGLFGLATLLALFLSYSRSAWLGAALSILIVLALSIKNPKLKKWGGVSLVAIVLILGGVTLALKNNTKVENIITHTQQHSAVKTTSDQGHISALKAGLKDVVRQPLGRGPGTAGPASVYNNHPARIAENYFIQIAQEVGWIGLALFLLINWLVLKPLWLNKSDSLSAILFASLIGIYLVGFFSHVWVDDTLSYIWWGLAGIVLAPALLADKTRVAKLNK